jgi:hypothetical protein
MKGKKAIFEKRPIPCDWNTPCDCTAELLIGGISSCGNELYYLINTKELFINRCEIENTEYRTEYAKYLSTKMKVTDLPYGVSSFENIILAYLQPHEGLKLPDGRIVIAMHNADYIRIINFEDEWAGNYPNEDHFTPQIYSATNSFSKLQRKLYFAQWNLDERIARYCGSEIPIKISIKSINEKFDINSEIDIGCIEGIEGVHEVKCSPDNNSILLTEFCLQAKNNVPSLEVENLEWKDYDGWKRYEDEGLRITQLQCIDIKTKKVQKIIPFGFTPGHVEFSNRNINKFYVSCHSMSKANGKIILHTQGVLQECEIENHKLRACRNFTTPEFLRLTSHKIFEYEGMSYIAITVYPNYLYIFEDDTFKLLETVELFECDRIDISHMHVCDLDDRTPLWLETSDNGKYIILISNQYIYFYNIETKETTQNFGYNWYNDFQGTAHVTNMNDFTIN